jgi:hypothetical protein
VRIAPEQSRFPVVKKPEEQGLPGANIPGEQRWRPYLPEDFPKVEAFIKDLAQHKEEIQHHLKNFLQRPDITLNDAIWQDYLNVSVNRLVFDTDPFAGQSPREHWLSKTFLALDATHVAELWLDEHPTSLVAKIIAEQGIDAPAFIHQAFLYEVWPVVGPKRAEDRES